MFQRFGHRRDDVDLVMSAVGDDPLCLPVLVELGGALRGGVASALREVIATGAWQQDLGVRREAAHWRHEPRFGAFLEQDLERRRDRGPKREHLDAALLMFPETRAALYRVDAAQCPQHCRAETGTFSEDRHTDDYRQALFGWYAAIQHAHACVVRAVRWFKEADPSDPRRPQEFTQWLARTGSRRGRRAADGTAPAASQEAVREILLMMHAWSPHTFEAMDVAFRKAEGEQAFHAWGGGFEPAGRSEAQAAAEALADVLSPQERQHVRGVMADIESEDVWDRDMTLAKDSALPCTSDRHRAYGTGSGDREDCAKARDRVYEEASRPWDEGADRKAGAARLARFLLGARADRVKAVLTTARTAVARDSMATAPQVWHDSADLLREAREAAGLDLHDAAGHLDIKPHTLQRFEQAAGKLPGRPVSLSYLQLLTVACTQGGHPVPACIPQAFSEPVTALPTTL
ncbi:helix-turn-helix domain-containing protein [Streptomyces huiliensis]|uniref:helix-turn-helix domain-containing protein n=1 Tax=Streptomyces huiliensis TaxID=2876027 RepID=UPI001CBEE7E7|nr:helix-turn-helix domain-containing protein [Streptomyces huiliensis]MBZ4319916.1 helix-turn-helix domain-containing protein [Streptomyces huiliensis]